VTNKIAGLYVSLAKALNALEEAGEDPDSMYEAEITGISGRVAWDPESERWTVDQQA
jgi:hypothetical protein